MRYQPLDYARHDIRLLQVLPDVGGHHTWPVRCRLLHTSLSQAPDYHALSYYWGDPSQVQTIILDEEKVEVRTNLAQALQELRRREINLLWVDAVCINQSNLAERAEQVLRMGRIYTQAHSVIAWLGPAAQQSDLALDVLSGRRKAGTGCWHAICSLMWRPFWSRVWIVQEISKAKTVQILCGSASANWDSVMADDSMIYYLTAMSPPKDEFFREVFKQIQFTALHSNELLRTLQTFRSNEQRARFGEARIPLLTALLLSQRSLASDPRDKIYALLSLTSDGYEIVPTPDYSKPASRVYAEAAHNIIVARGHTAALLLARRPPDSVEHIPSWTPDWRFIDNDLPPRILRCVEASRCTFRVSGSFDWRVLEVPGVPLKTTAAVASARGVPPHSRDGPYGCQKRHRSRRKSQQDEAILEPLWNAVDRRKAGDVLAELCDALAMGVCWSDNEYKLRHRVIASFNNAGDPHDERSHSHMMRVWLKENENLRIGSQSLGKWISDWRHSPVSIAEEWYRGRPYFNGIRRIPEDGLERMERYKMRIAVAVNGAIRVVYQEASLGDEICRLKNCKLPVVLRRTRAGYKYVGEVFVTVANEGSSEDSDLYWTRGAGWSAEDVRIRKRDVIRIG